MASSGLLQSIVDFTAGLFGGKAKAGAAEGDSNRDPHFIAGAGSNRDPHLSEPRPDEDSNRDPH